jgi:hypothetical protein
MGQSPIVRQSLPWLYSLSFSITLGVQVTIFACCVVALLKMKLLYCTNVLVCNHAQQIAACLRSSSVLLKLTVETRVVVVTVHKTALSLGLVRVTDVATLTSWITVYPFLWERKITMMYDKHGRVLELDGYCNAQHWAVFEGFIAVFHFRLL